MAPSIALIAQNPKAVWDSIKQEIKDSFSDNMINGTDRSRARYSTYVLLSVADIFIGTHGAGAATKGAANLSKINKIPSRNLKHSFQQTKQWQPLLENKQFTGMHVVNRKKFQEDFLLPSKLMTKEMNFHKTNYLVPYSSESVKNLRNTARQIEESRVVGKGIDEINKEITDVHNVKEAKDIIAERTKGLNIKEHPTTTKQMSSTKMKELKDKIDNRTITKQEYADYIWNKKFAKRRDKGVKEFWYQEQQRLLNNEPLTRDWSQEQLKDILAGKGEIIYPAIFNEHLKGWHGGNWRNSIPGEPIIPIKDF